MKNKINTQMSKKKIGMRLKKADLLCGFRQDQLLCLSVLYGINEVLHTQKITKKDQEGNF